MHQAKLAPSLQYIDGRHRIHLAKLLRDSHNTISQLRRNEKHYIDVEKRLQFKLGLALLDINRLEECIVNISKPKKLTRQSHMKLPF